MAPALLKALSSWSEHLIWGLPGLLLSPKFTENSWLSGSSLTWSECVYARGMQMAREHYKGFLLCSPVSPLKTEEGQSRRAPKGSFWIHFWQWIINEGIKKGRVQSDRHKWLNTRREKSVFPSRVIADTTGRSELVLQLPPRPIHSGSLNWAPSSILNPSEFPLHWVSQLHCLLEKLIQP